MGLKRGRGSPEYLVYALLDPDTHEVRYVGKSSRGLARARAHFEPAYSQRHRGYKANWLKALQTSGKRPVICVLSRHASNEEVLQAEMDYIRLYRQLGARLTNQTAGGEGTVGRRPSSEEIERSAAKRRGRTYTPERIARIRATKEANGTFRRSPSAEERAKIAATLRAKGGMRLRGVNQITGEVVEFPSLRAARLAGHSPRAIENCLKNIQRRPRSFESRNWRWERVDGAA